MQSALSCFYEGFTSWETEKEEKVPQGNLKQILGSINFAACIWQTHFWVDLFSLKIKLILRSKLFGQKLKCETGF